MRLHTKRGAVSRKGTGDGGGASICSSRCIMNIIKNSHLGALMHEMTSRRQSLSALSLNPKMDSIRTWIWTLQGQPPWVPQAPVLDAWSTGATWQACGYLSLFLPQHLMLCCSSKISSFSAWSHSLLGGGTQAEAIYLSTKHIMGHPSWSRQVCMGSGD